MSTLDLISKKNYLILNKILIKKLGLNEAIIIAHIASFQVFFGDKYFFQTYENIAESTSLSKHKSSKAINHLIDLKILSVKKTGMPSKNHYKINEKEVKKILSPGVKKFNDKELKNLTTRSEKIKRHVVKKLNPTNNLYIYKYNKKEKDKKEKKEFDLSKIKNIVVLEKIHDFIKYRTAIKKKIKTQRTINLIIKEVMRCKNQNEAVKLIDLSMDNGWVGVNYHWLINRQNTANKSPNKRNDSFDEFWDNIDKKELPSEASDLDD